MAKLTEFVPYNHDSRDVVKALGVKDESMLFQMFDKHGNFDRLLFRLWLFDLINLPFKTKILPPFYLAPRLIAITLCEVIATEKLEKDVVKASASEIVEAIEKFLEEDPEALDCAIRAAHGSISFYNILRETDAHPIRVLLLHLFYQHANVELPKSLEDPKFLQLFEKCDLAFWYQFPFNILVNKVDNWSHKLLKSLRQLLDISPVAEQLEQLICRQAQSFFSAVTVEDEHVEELKRLVKRPAEKVKELLSLGDIFQALKELDFD